MIYPRGGLVTHACFASIWDYVICANFQSTCICCISCLPTGAARSAFRWSQRGICMQLRVFVCFFLTSNTTRSWYLSIPCVPHGMARHRLLILLVIPSTQLPSNCAGLVESLAVKLQRTIKIAAIHSTIRLDVITSTDIVSKSNDKPKYASCSINVSRHI